MLNQVKGSGDNEEMKKKVEFCKKLLIADYVILALLLIVFCLCVLRFYDTSNFAVILGAWITQIGITTGFYCWKAKAENMIKLPIYLLESLPAEMKERTDPNQVIMSVLGSTNY